jgi:hypothetical protein
MIYFRFLKTIRDKGITTMISDITIKILLSVSDIIFCILKIKESKNITNPKNNNFRFLSIKHFL